MARAVPISSLLFAEDTVSSYIPLGPGGSLTFPQFVVTSAVHDHDVNLSINPGRMIFDWFDRYAVLCDGAQFTLTVIRRVHF